MSSNKLKQQISLRQLHIEDAEVILILAVSHECLHVRFKLRYQELENNS